MERIRISVAGLMIVVLFVGVTMAAFSGPPTVLWASLAFTLAVGVMCVAVVGALARRGRARMSWAGFSIFGLAYLGIAFGPATGGNGATPPPFPTMVLYTYLSGPLKADMNSLRDDPQPKGEDIRIFTARPPILVVNFMNLRRIVHSFGAVLFALIGAILGRLFAPAPQELTGGESLSRGL